MSSILEALKKAERESAKGRDGDLPLPSPLPERSPYPMVRRRWWLPLGIVGILSIGIVLFWQLQRPDPSWPTAVPAPPAAPGKQQITPPANRLAERPEPPTSPKEKAPAFAQAPDAESASQPRAQTPAATTAADQPAQRAVRIPPAPQAAKAPPARPPETLSPPPESAPENANAPSGQARVSPGNAVGTPRSSTPPLEKSDKNYRSDPRIALQALVWSPDAAERFVIINDSLIKEGGSVEGIVVVRINPDDVLVSEGSKRWHEPFKIR